MYEKKVEYHTSNTFDVYKLFNYTDADYSVDGLKVNECLAPQSDDIWNLENTHSYNYNFLNHNYYSSYNDSRFYSFKSKYYNQKKYILSERCKYISIPMRRYGYRILPGSFTLVDNSSDEIININDDSNGNLIDSSISTTNFISDDTLVFKFSFDDAYKTKTCLWKGIHSLSDSFNYGRKIKVVNGTFSTGINNEGYRYNMDGNSHAYIEIDDNEIDFDKDDFTLSFWANFPYEQSHHSGYHTLISKKDISIGTFPFEIKLTDGSSDEGENYIVVSKRASKGNNLLTEKYMVSTNIINIEEDNHICLLKSGSNFELYINGNLEASMSSNYSGVFSSQNGCPIYVGANGYDINSVSTSSYFSGSMDDIRLYKSAVNVENLYNHPKDTNIVGNIFYEHGIIVFNDLSGRYENILLGSDSDGFTLSYSSVSQITEHEIYLKKGAGDFNLTMNSSLRKENSLVLIDQVTSSFATSSNFSFTPYITGIGLYNDNNELLATAKIREPIKSIPDIDLFFKIKFDM